MINGPNKIMTYLRTKPSKITRCQRLIIHAIKIVLRGTTFMLLNRRSMTYIKIN